MSRAASGIAAMIGDCSVDEALAQAKPRFRCVVAQQISPSYMEISPVQELPTVDLFTLTEHCDLGDCDAFVSHSWRDCPTAKWESLQHWRQIFIAKHGREPRIWFDKACIDQTDINADLRGLPIFLAGCKELLVLCGPSYLSRLWCLMEIFTFVHMGGDPARISIVKIIRRGAEVEDSKAIEAALRNFDVARCDCSYAPDKTQLVEVIRTGFGSLQNFNAVLRKLLAESGFSKHPEAEEENGRSKSCFNSSLSFMNVEFTHLLL